MAAAIAAASLVELSGYVELGLALKLLADSAAGVDYLLKDRISEVDDFVGAFGESPTAAPPWTR